MLILIAEFWVSLFPDDKPDAYNFFQNYLNIFFVMFVMCIYLVWKKFNVVFLVNLKDVDINTGRRVDDLDQIRQEIAEEKAYIASKPLYYRMYKFWC